jgi:polyphenol oxidase
VAPGPDTITALERELALQDGRSAWVRFTGAAEGDLRITRPRPDLLVTRAGIVDRPWSWVRQVHGAEVVRVEAPGDQAGVTEADALVTSVTDAVLAIHTADCAPVALVSPEGVVAAAHAGWRGLEAGVLQATLEQMRRAGARRVHAVLGPCIHARCYEFGPELDRLGARFGPEVRARTTAGHQALDLPAAVRAELGSGRVTGIDVTGIEVVDICTACDPRFFSHRARGDEARQALVVHLRGDVP